MSDIKDRVKLYTDEDVNHPFEGDPNIKVTGIDGTWGQTNYILPFPCYSHDIDLVVTMAEKVENLFPIKWKPKYSILPFDVKSLTNGWAEPGRKYNGEKKGKADEFRPLITLSGKRIPIHPAMTRYLVAHEYGHCVDYWINYCMGYDESEDQFDSDYAKMRGISLNTQYGGRRWHTNTGEIIANDFRIAICDVESEFWPHDVEHPLNCPNVLDFWKEMKEKYAITNP